MLCELCLIHPWWASEAINYLWPRGVLSRSGLDDHRTDQHERSLVFCLLPGESPLFIATLVLVLVFCMRLTHSTHMGLVVCSDLRNG